MEEIEEKSSRLTPEDLARLLLEALKRSGRYAGSGAVLILPPGALASIFCVLHLVESEVKP